jgi:hypothetical protein
MRRPVFIVQVQAAELGVDEIRSLKAWLKIGLRVFGLRSISIEKVEVKPKEQQMADMRKFASGLIRPEDLHDGSRQERIINVYISEKYKVPILTFESGDELIAWNNIARALVRSYGYEDTDWVGHVVELSLGNYTNKDGETKENIVLKPISSRDCGSNGGPQRVDPAKLPKPKDDMDDEIPFA